MVMDNRPPSQSAMRPQSTSPLESLTDIDTCPAFALREDSKTAALFPSPNNRCYNRRKPATINLEYQSTTCLTHKHIHCPIALQSLEGELPEERFYTRWIHDRLFITRLAIASGILILLVSAILIWFQTVSH
jgi:hypothetical protein